MSESVAQSETQGGPECIKRRAHRHIEMCHCTHSKNVHQGSLIPAGCGVVGCGCRQYREEKIICGSDEVRGIGSTDPSESQPDATTITSAEWYEIWKMRQHRFEMAEIAYRAARGELIQWKKYQEANGIAWPSEDDDE